MRTDKINMRTNFYGFYRMPNTPKNAEFINEQLIPVMEKLEYPHFISSDRMPTAKKFFQYFSDIAEHHGGSLNWLRNHAKRYNVELPADKREMITIAVGVKDAIKMKKFEIKLLGKTIGNYLKMTAKMLFGIKTKAYIPGEPHYIEDIRLLTGAYKKQAALFDSFLEKNNAVKVNNGGELTKSIINEMKPYAD